MNLSIYRYDNPHLSRKDNALYKSILQHIIGEVTALSADVFKAVATEKTPDYTRSWLFAYNWSRCKNLYNVLTINVPDGQEAPDFFKVGFGLGAAAGTKSVVIKSQKEKIEISTSDLQRQQELLKTNDFSLIAAYTLGKVTYRASNSLLVTTLFLGDDLLEQGD